MRHETLVARVIEQSVFEAHRGVLPIRDGEDNYLVVFENRGSEADQATIIELVSQRASDVGLCEWARGRSESTAVIILDDDLEPLDEVNKWIWEAAEITFGVGDVTNGACQRSIAANRIASDAGEYCIQAIANILRKGIDLPHE